MDEEAAMRNRYPPGYRFVPTDAELIVEYLKKKIDNEPLPIAEINDTELIKQNPWGLTEKYPKLGDKEWYFFTPRNRKYPNGRRPNRGSKDGYWKPTGADIAVTVGDETVGFKKALVFYKGKPQEGVKTNWIMHEFRVIDSEHKKTTPGDMKLDDWVLCRIYENTTPKLTTTTTTNKRKKKTNTNQSQSKSKKGKAKQQHSLSAVSVSVDESPSSGESCETAAAAAAAAVVNNLPIINPYCYNNNDYMINNTTGDYSSLEEDLMEQSDPMNLYLNEDAFTNVYLNQQPYASSSSSSSSWMAMAPYLNEPQPLGFQSSLPPNNNTNFAPFYGYSQNDDNQRFRFY